MSKTHSKISNTNADLVLMTISGAIGALEGTRQIHILEDHPLSAAFAQEQIDKLNKARDIMFDVVLHKN